MLCFVSFCFVSLCFAVCILFFFLFFFLRRVAVFSLHLYFPSLHVCGYFFVPRHVPKLCSCTFQMSLRALFDLLDKDGSGEVDAKEWGRNLYANKAEMAKHLGGDVKALSTIGRLFNTADSDGNDSLDWAEFQALAKQAALKALFEELDEDNSGTVSSKEWGKNVYKKREALAAAFGGSTTVIATIGKLFNTADTDGDDQLSWDEFFALAKKAEAELASYPDQSNLRAVFELLDTDKSGGVSAKEWGRNLRANKDAMAKHFGGNPDVLSTIGRLFSLADGDGDDNLTWDEFLGLAKQAALKALFEELDVDNSGTVSSKEWGRNVYKKREALTAAFGGSAKAIATIGRLFNTADTDGDDELTWDEFLALAKKAEF